MVDATQGKDGLVRVVKVLVQGKVYTRGLNTIHPLNIEEGGEEESLAATAREQKPL